MVLQHANRLHGAGTFASLFRLDPARIAACSGAIALNVLVLLLLLVPATAPMLRIVPPEKGIVLVDLTPKPITPPAPPVVPVRPQTPTPVQTRTVVPRDVPVAPVDQVVVPDGSLPADPMPTVATADPAPTTLAPPTGPIAGVQLQYAQAPSPSYPVKELRDGTQGTVMLRVLVDVDGRPLQVDIERSSGNRNLDEAARRAVLKRWMFKPAMQDGHAVQAIGIVPIDFTLQ